MQTERTNLLAISQSRASIGKCETTARTRRTKEASAHVWRLICRSCLKNTRDHYDVLYFMSNRLTWSDILPWTLSDRSTRCVLLKKITLFLTFNWVLDWKSLTKAEEAGIWKPQLPDWNQKNQIRSITFWRQQTKEKNTKRKTYKESWSDRVKNKSNFLVFFNQWIAA